MPITPKNSAGMITARPTAAAGRAGCASSISGRPTSPRPGAKPTNRAPPRPRRAEHQRRTPPALRAFDDGDDQRGERAPPEQRAPAVDRRRRGIVRRAAPTRATRTSVTITTGTLTRNTEPHQKCASRSPPISGPTAVNVPPTPDQTEIAVPAFLLRGRCCRAPRASTASCTRHRRPSSPRAIVNAGGVVGEGGRRPTPRRRSRGRS